MQPAVPAAYWIKGSVLRLRTINGYSPVHHLALRIANGYYAT